MSKDITLNVNGIDHHVNIKGNETLLKVLRDKLGLTAAKEGCGAGECGACAVIYDGSPTSSCLILAVEAEGVEILTLEGITPKDHLHPIQQAFIDKGAVQCGFCTPGMIVTTYSLLKSNPDPTEEEIKKAISGNLCRCTGYVQISEAIREAARRLKRSKGRRK